MYPLTIIVYAALGIAGAAIVGAVLMPHQRAQLLALACLGFVVAGVLGILSIGLLFLIAAAVCAVLAFRTRPRSGVQG